MEQQVKGETQTMGGAEGINGSFGKGGITQSNGDYGAAGGIWSFWSNKILVCLPKCSAASFKMIKADPYIYWGIFFS